MASAIDHTYLVLSKDRTDKICRLVPRCLGLNTVFFVVATWLTKASTNSELQKQLAQNIGLAFIIFFYKNGNGIWVKLSKKKKGGVKHNRNAIIIFYPLFWLELSQIPVNKWMIMIWNISLDHFVWANARYQSHMMQLLSTPKCLSKQLISYAVFHAVLFCILVWCF